MAHHGLLVGEKTGNVLNLKFMLAEDSDHFLDQLEAEELENVLNGPNPQPRDNNSSRPFSSFSLYCFSRVLAALTAVSDKAIWGSLQARRFP